MTDPVIKMLDELIAAVKSVKFEDEDDKLPKLEDRLLALQDKVDVLNKASKKH